MTNEARAIFKKRHKATRFVKDGRGWLVYCKEAHGEAYQRTTGKMAGCDIRRYGTNANGHYLVVMEVE